MNNSRYKKNPARRKSIPEQIADYKKNIRQRPVSGTKETESTFDFESTDYVPPSSTPPPKEQTPHRLGNLNLYIGIIVGILTVLTVIVGTVYKFASVEKGMENLEKNVSANKGELKEMIIKSEDELRKDINRINDRIDGYYSTKKQDKD